LANQAIEGIGQLHKNICVKWWY